MTDENFEADPMMGKKVKDKVTGFTGIVTGKLESLYGCAQFVVTSSVGEKNKADDTKAVLDEGRLVVIGQGIRPKEVKAKTGKPGADSVPTEIGTAI